jgi:hypothetical protein
VDDPGGRDRGYRPRRAGGAVLIARFVPLDLKDFPGEQRPQKNSQFKAGWQSTLDLLDSELTKLGARNIVVQAGFRRDQIRQDGWPMGKALPVHAAVIVSFNDREKRPLSFPCHRYSRYDDNLRAIALSLEALRAVDRHGVTKRGEQYMGFKALDEAKPWSVEEAAQFIAIKGGTSADLVINHSNVYRAAYRKAASTLHPDAGGNPHEWQLLCDAKALLDGLHVRENTA